MSGIDVVSGPFAHDRTSVSRIMVQVCLALLPCTLFGLYLFGWPAINLLVVTCTAALACEAACLRLLGQPVKRVLDGSAFLTALLLALCLPPWAPWWVGVFGSCFAIGLGKQLYGGVGQNLFNPAMLARVALLIAFPIQMTYWPKPSPLFAAGSPDFLQGLQITFGGLHMPDAVAGATNLGNLKTQLTLGHKAIDILASDFSFLPSFTGYTGGSFGETSEVLILFGGLWLLLTGVISWEIPLAMALGVLLPALLASHISPERYPGALYHLSSGGLLMGMFFIATDPVTSPVSRDGRLLFGAGVGFLVYVIRTWGNFPEAVAFAVVFMNALTPLIDRYLKPRAYGRNSRGKPLVPANWTRRVKRKDRV